MKIERKDVLSQADYNRIRPDFRAQVMQIKDDRRFIVGPYLCFLFENRMTMLYQIQEMLRAESITSEAGIEHEIQTYNQLVPGKYELTATLLLEFADENVRAVKLKELVGLEKQVHLLMDQDVMVQADFDDTQCNVEKLSSVQYIRFQLGQSGTDAFLTAREIEIVLSHPACSYREIMPRKIADALKADLKAAIQ